MKKEFEFGDDESGKIKVVVRQASGLDRMKWEAAQGRALRKFREYGTDVENWTEEQQNNFVEYLDEENVGVEMQITEWIPKCIVEPEDFDLGILTSNELRQLLLFVRGDTADGAVPLV